MLNSFSEDLKRVLLAGVGAAALTAEKSIELINTFVQKGELTIEQGKVLNEELKHKFKEGASETKSKFVMDSLDKMNKEEIAAVKNKLAELEKAGKNGSETGEKQ